MRKTLVFAMYLYRALAAPEYQHLDEAWMTRAVVAAQVTMLVANDETELDADFESFETVRWYIDDESPSSTRAAIATHETGLYVAFYGKFRRSRVPMVSFASSLVTSTYEKVCSINSDGGDDSCCSMRHQWIDVYENASWMSALETDLMELSSSDDVDRPVVLSGHQFGAGLAQIAAIRWHDTVDPYFISFSQPRLTNLSACSVNRDRWVRFLNTREDLRLHIVWMVYDTNSNKNVPPVGIWSRKPSNVGHLFVMGGNGLDRWAYLGVDGRGPTWPYDRSQLTTMMTTKGVTDIKTLGFDPPNVGDGYYDRLVATQNSLWSYDDPSITGYRYRALCTMNMECQSQHCARAAFDAPFRCQNPQ